MKQARVFKVFISSTFIDFVAEREALQERVWPRLRVFCRAHDTEFQAVDLRWGINQEAALDQRTALICLEELDRCQRLSPRPSLVILLGDRYGWRPLPYQIAQPEFERIIAAVPALDTAGLLRWYRLDENAVPAAFVLQPRRGDHRDPAVWAGEEKLLRTCLEAGAAAAGIDPTPYRLSATHLEILAGTGASAPTENWFGFFRTIADTNADTLARAGYLDLTGTGERDGEAVRAGTPKPDISSVDAFKRALVSGGAVGYTDPARGGTSGVYVAGLIERLGIGTELKPKTKLSAGIPALVEALAGGDIEIGMLQISEIVPDTRLSLVGPLPPGLERTTVISAGVMTSSAQPEASRAFIKFLMSPAAVSVMRAKGMEAM